MGTRSTIARKTAEGIESIYCHWDGYPTGVGNTLKGCWSSDDKVAALMALGDLSVLGSEIGTKTSFEAFRDIGSAGCLAYGRDRGETGAEAIVDADEDAWLDRRKGNACEYAYLWDGSDWNTYEL